MISAPSKNAALAILCLVIFLDAMSVGLILPVMPALIINLSTLPVSRAAEIGGYLLFIFAAMQFLFAPLLGALSDRFGRRRVLLLAVFGFSLDYFIMAVAPNLVWLFVARFLSGIFGATYAAANAGIVDITEPEKRARNFGIAGAAVGVGLVFGPAIGGLLGDINMRLPFLAAGVLTMTLFVAGVFFLPETLPPEKRRAFSWGRANPLGSLMSVAKSPIVLGVLASLFCVQLASQSYNSVWAFFTMEVAGWGPREIGLSVTLYGFLMALVQGVLTGPVVARFGEVRVALFAISVGVCVYLGLAFANSAGLILFWVVAGSLSGFAFPALQSLMSKNTADDAQGELQGVVAASYSLTAIIGPLAMTQIFSAYTDRTNAYFPGAPYILASLLIVASLLAFAYSMRRKTRMLKNDED